MRAMFGEGQRRLMAAGRTATTDDLGAFRVFDLLPGQYYLMASVPADRDQGPDVRVGYLTGLYPSTTTLADARVVSVGANQVVPNLVVRLSPVRTVNVSGRAVSASGAPMSGRIVTALTRGMSVPTAAGNASVAADGSFAIVGLAPGDYTLRITGVRGEVLTTEVSLDREDMPDVLILGKKMPMITGHVIIDKAQIDPTLYTAVQIRAVEIVAGTGGINITSTTVAPDGAFSILAPGDVVRLEAFKTPEGWNVGGVRRRGIDVGDEGLRIADRNEDVDLVLTDEWPRVTGRVQAPIDANLSTCAVIVFPQDRDLWNGQSRNVAMSHPSIDGTFAISSLRQGNYIAVAVDQLNGGDWRDPSVLEELVALGRLISLKDRSTTNIELPLTQLR
jgi:hypothetical protein